MLVLDKTVFKAKFQEWEALPGIGDPVYHSEYLWTEVGQRPLDVRLSALAELYLDADPDQRQLIRDYFQVRSDPQRRLISYVRRIIKFIQTMIDPNQEQSTRNYFQAIADRQWELIIYVRRIGKLIKSVNDTKWLRLGLAVASIKGAGGEWRDLIVSLVILRYAAERLGIETGPFFDEIMRITNPESRGIFENAIKMGQRNVKDIIKTSSTLDWAGEI